MELINNNKTFIIAEAGCNHNGKISLALKLIMLLRAVVQMQLNFKYSALFRWYQNIPKRSLFKKKKKMKTITNAKNKV